MLHLEFHFEFPYFPPILPIENLPSLQNPSQMLPQILSQLCGDSILDFPIVLQYFKLPVTVSFTFNLVKPDSKYLVYTRPLAGPRITEVKLIVHDTILDNGSQNMNSGYRLHGFNSELYFKLSMEPHKSYLHPQSLILSSVKCE